MSNIFIIDGDEEFDGVKKVWQCTDDNEATWALRIIAKRKTEIERLTQIANSEIERIKDWLSEEVAKETRSVEFFESKLVAYHRELQESGAAGKTYKLPTGELKSKTQPPKVLIDDNAQLIEWAKENAKEILVEKHEISIMKNALNDLVVTTREKRDGKETITDARFPNGSGTIPGAHIEFTQEDAYSVKVK